jgi:hypothetical protein
MMLKGRPCRECGQGTTHDKPYCYDHVELNPHASEVRRTMGDPTWLEADDALVTLRVSGPQNKVRIRPDALRMLLARGLVRVDRLKDRNRGSWREVVVLC